MADLFLNTDRSSRRTVSSPANSSERLPLRRPSDSPLHERDAELAHLLACYGMVAPPNLGTDLFRATVARLERRELAVALAPEVFRQKLRYAAEWLEENDAASVRSVEAWLRQIFETPLRSLFSESYDSRLAS